MQRPWLAHYPKGVPAETGPLPFDSLAELLSEAFRAMGPSPPSASWAPS